MQRKLSSRSTFKPQLESLETRDLLSGAGIVLYLEAGSFQQTVQTMQTQANAVQTTFNKLGTDDAALIAATPGTAAFNTALQSLYTDDMKIGGEIQTVRALNTQLQAQLSNFQQSVFMVAGDGDQSDQGLALFAYLQVNGGFGGLLGGSSSGGGVSSQAQNALNQVDQIASSHTTPNGITLTQTIDQRLNS